MHARFKTATIIGVATEGIGEGRLPPSILIIDFEISKSEVKCVAEER